MQHGHTRPRQFDRSGSARIDAAFVQAHDAFERGEVLFGQRQPGLRLHDVDAGESDIQSEAAGGIGDLLLGDFALISGGIQAQLALVAALPGHVDAERELRRPGVVGIAEAGAEGVQVVGGVAGNGIGTQARRNHGGLGNRKAGPLGDQRRIMFDRFGHGFAKGNLVACRRKSGTRHKTPER